MKAYVIPRLQCGACGMHMMHIGPNDASHHRLVHETQVMVVACCNPACGEHGKLYRGKVEQHELEAA